MSLRVSLLHERAIVPERKTEGSVGYDLCACEDAVIMTGARRQVVDTGVAVELPPGCYGRVAPRSGLAVNKGVHVGAGVIDPDYRGSIKVLLFNYGAEPLHVSVGDRIAQLILEKAMTPPVEVVVDGPLDATARGANGFGSTG